MNIQHIGDAEIQSIKKIFSNTPINTTPTWQRTVRPTKIKIIAAIAVDIAGMRRKGYSTAYIADLISDNLFDINADTLRAFMRTLGISMFFRAAEVRAENMTVVQDVRQDGNNFANALHDAKELLLTQSETVNGFMDVLNISNTAKAALRKMSAADVTLFRQAAASLAPGRQMVQVSEDVQTYADNLVGAGLFIRRKKMGARVYEIPPHFAQARRIARHAQPGF